MVIGNSFYNKISQTSSDIRTTGGSQTGSIKQPAANIGIAGNASAIPTRRIPANNTGFGDVLQNKLQKAQELKFSRHAETRMMDRSINLTQVQKNKINEAVDKACSKGVKDTLVLMDNMAFVVNVKNKTVITAVNSGELKDNVFTNIDGAVVV